jgi:hypothetical protein
MMSYEDGIYRTTQPLPGFEGSFPAGKLVLIRTDAEYGPASVLLGQGATYNNWSFTIPGVKLSDGHDAWGASLVKLPNEGFYALKKERVFGPDNKWFEGAIVQLGYNRSGEGLLFIAKRRPNLAENDLFFGDKGVKISDAEFGDLMPLAWNATS